MLIIIAVAGCTKYTTENPNLNDNGSGMQVRKIAWTTIGKFDHDIIAARIFGPHLYTIIDQEGLYRTNLHDDPPNWIHFSQLEPGTILGCLFTCC